MTCKKVMTVDTEVHIRHGSAPALRRVPWLLTDHTFGEPLLGRPVIGALGLDTHEILTEAAEKYYGVVKVFELLKSKRAAEGKVARLLDGVLNSDGGADDADLDEGDG